MDDAAPRKPVHIPPLAGDVVLAWPLAPSDDPDEWVAVPSWELGDQTLTPDTDTMHHLAAALEQLLNTTRGKVLVDCVEVYAAPGDVPMFTYRITFKGKHWRPPAD